MKKQKKKRVSKKGLPPGSKVYIGEQRSTLPLINVISYSAEEYLTSSGQDGSILPHSIEDMVHWINIDGIHDVEMVDEICKRYGVHSLTVEDILNTFQRPKIEIFDNYIYCVLKMLTNHPTDDALMEEQVSLILTNDVVISFQEQPGDVFDPVRQRLSVQDSKLRLRTSDFLFYALLDVIVDNYIDIIEKKSEEVYSLEQQVINHSSEKELAMILDTKSDLLYLRKAIFPMREAVAKINRADCPLIDKSNIAYFGDLYDHIVQVIENIDLQREINNDQKESYHSALSNRMNKVMEILTIVTTIFIPLSFIAGVYGMNFKVMPELDSPNGYYLTLLFMALVAIVMIVYFKIKKWL